MERNINVLIVPRKSGWKQVTPKPSNPPVVPMQAISVIPFDLKSMYIIDITLY